MILIFFSAKREDTYKKCVRDAVRKCIVRDGLLAKTGIDKDLLTPMIDYTDCIEEAGYDCDAPMLDHFIAIVKAYQKHLEKNNGEFGKMTENTGSNHWSTISDNRVS